jgi:hypothetical protein
LPASVPLCEFLDVSLGLSYSGLNSIATWLGKLYLKDDRTNAGVRFPTDKPFV